MNLPTAGWNGVACIDGRDRLYLSSKSSNQTFFTTEEWLLVVGWFQTSDTFASWNVVAIQTQPRSRSRWWVKTKFSTKWVFFANATHWVDRPFFYFSLYSWWSPPLSVSINFKYFQKPWNWSLSDCKRLPRRRRGGWRSRGWSAAG